MLRTIFGDFVDRKEDESPSLGQARGKVVLCNERRLFKGRGLAGQASSDLRAIWDKDGIKGVWMAPESALLKTPEMFAGRELSQFMRELEPLCAGGEEGRSGDRRDGFPGREWAVYAG